MPQLAGHLKGNGLIDIKTAARPRLNVNGRVTFLVFLREHQVQHDGGIRRRRRCRKEQGFQPVRRELQDQRLLETPMPTASERHIMMARRFRRSRDTMRTPEAAMVPEHHDGRAAQDRFKMPVAANAAQPQRERHHEADVAAGDAGQLDHPLFWPKQELGKVLNTADSIEFRPLAVHAAPSGVSYTAAR